MTGFETMARPLRLVFVTDGCHEIRLFDFLIDGKGFLVEFNHRRRIMFTERDTGL